MPEVTLNIFEASAAIRKAWRTSRKRVFINGVMFVVTRKVHNVVYTSGGLVVRRKESWLVAKPADGSLLPTYNVEHEAQGNLRSK